MNFIMVFRVSGTWTMLGLSFCCTRVWTIVPQVRRRVKSSTLPKYTFVVDFISLEKTYFFEMPFVVE
jgi:hypothetical protein